jgi:hypothetical protein
VGVDALGPTLADQGAQVDAMCPTPTTTLPLPSGALARHGRPPGLIVASVTDRPVVGIEPAHPPRLIVKASA